MSRPEVTRKNYREVYDFYSKYNPNVRIAKFGYWSLAMSVGPKITVVPGASEAITQHLDNGGKLIVTANHTSEWDIPSIASLASKVRAMHPLRGNIFIPTKSALSQNPLLRRAVDTMGQLPTFRSKDVRDQKLQVGEPTSGELKHAVTSTSSALINRGKHMAIFPEGERNKERPNVVQPLKDGILHIIAGVHPVQSLAWLPVGIHHDPDASGRLYFRHPSIHVGMPQEVLGPDNSLLTDLCDSLQECVDIARTS